MQQELARIFDANLNRAREGLRVVEELVRLGWESVALQKQIKQLRHAITQSEKLFPQEPLLIARAVGQDPGARLTLFSERKKVSWKDITQANFRRCQEALRVLEEFSKLKHPAASQRFKQLRFRAYDLEALVIKQLLQPSRRGPERRGGYRTRAFKPLIRSRVRKK